MPTTGGFRPATFCSTGWTSTTGLRPADEARINMSESQRLALVSGTVQSSEGTVTVGNAGRQSHHHRVRRHCGGRPCSGHIPHGGWAT
ncbi:MAG: hypothetical protein R3A10_00835 [Caldilineaceae bacterium]